MANKKPEMQTEVITIPPIEKKQAILTIVGDSPLICHNWSKKARDIINNPDAIKNKKHEPRNPMYEAIESLYWISGKPTEYTDEAFAAAISSGARFGFPATALKDSAVTGGYRAGILSNKVSGYAGFHILGELVEISGTPSVREDMVRVGMGKADVRWRAEFKEWSITFPITYNAGVFSAAHIVNLFNHGGYAVGIGDWRPEKGGSNGMYHVK